MKKIKKYLIVFITMLIFSISAFATESDEFDNVDEDLSDSYEEMVDLSKLQEMISDDEIDDYINSENNKFTSDEDTEYSILKIYATIEENTEVASDKIYLSIYNTKTNELKYIKLTKEDSFSSEITVPYGNYILLDYIYDDADTININDNIITLDNDYCEAYISIKGTEVEQFIEENEAVSEDNDLIEEATEIEDIVDVKNDETNVSQNNNNENNEKTFKDIILNLLYNNLLTIILVCVIVIILSIKKYKDNNNL